jgi:hypothetical protein
MLQSNIIPLLGLLLLPLQFSSTVNQPDTDPFEEYWLSGNGEINTYRLQQMSFGEVHEGTALLLFNVEDFSKSKQVRLDYPEKAGSDAIKVLKSNQIRSFNTGVYGNNIMQSVFTPIDLEKHPNSIKVTTSVQNWMGQVFTQLNLRPYQYFFKINSHLETEGDQEFQLNKAFLEDEIWNNIRINPDDLPTGSIQIIPSMITARLRHLALGVEDARASLQKGKEFSTYEINFTESDRNLKIKFRTAFPHVIEGWEESYQENGKKLSTTATLIKNQQLEYWNRRFNSDRKLRKELGLD